MCLRMAKTLRMKMFLVRFLQLTFYEVFYHVSEDGKNIEDEDVPPKVSTINLL